ncbi:MAG: hypothetical protein JO155_13405 [Acidimicrobiia bacterium]|nr:hypothetical protein [Acidimicrobiia bacterium]
MRRAAIALLAVIAVACTSRPSAAQKTAQRRENQARQVARDAGLSPAVQDFLALYAKASDSAFTVTYGPSQAGSNILLTQDPPLRRVDVVSQGLTRSVFVTRQGTYDCAQQDKQWACQQAQQQEGTPGLLAPADIARTVNELKAAQTNYTFAVTSRDIAGTGVRCLVTKPRPGVTGGSSTLCLSSLGAVLLVDGTGNPLQAVKYSTSVDDKKLRLPTTPEPPPIKP